MPLCFVLTWCPYDSGHAHHPVPDAGCGLPLREDMPEHISEAYSGRRFVRLCSDDLMPDTLNVRGTGIARIGVRKDKRSEQIVLVSVIDNLVKGAAGQAVQNMNIMLGLNGAGAGRRPLFRFNGSPENCARRPDSCFSTACITVFQKQRSRSPHRTARSFSTCAYFTVSDSAKVRNADLRKTESAERFENQRNQKGHHPLKITSSGTSRSHAVDHVDVDSHRR